jgi:hypothetical protein
MGALALLRDLLGAAGEQRKIAYFRAVPQRYPRPLVFATGVVPHAAVAREGRLSDDHTRLVNITLLFRAQERASTDMTMDSTT